MLCVLWLWKAVWWLVLECMLMCMGSGLVVGRVYSWAPVGCVRLHAVHFKELLKYTREIGLTSYMKLDMYTELLSLVLVFWNSSIQHRHHKHQVEATKHQSFHLINLNSYMDYILLTCCTLQRAIRTHTRGDQFHKLFTFTCKYTHQVAFVLWPHGKYCCTTCHLLMCLLSLKSCVLLVKTLESL